tara:strand:- start:206 stop:481 length:276 start_codon:yes stop_codon:yes gene_type:complete
MQPTTLIFVLDRDEKTLTLHEKSPLVLTNVDLDPTPEPRTMRDGSTRPAYDYWTTKTDSRSNISMIIVDKDGLPVTDIPSLNLFGTVSRLG